MRKLLPTVFLACLLIVPTALAAAGDPGPEHDRILVSSTLFSDPLDAAEARGRLRAAERSAKRAAAADRSKRAAETKAPAGIPAAAGVPPHLEAIAACESGGNPRAVGGGGAYRGKYQFSPATWAAIGGSGDPAAAPEAEQDRRAGILYAQSGASQWPVCGG